jgi:hypothetical protein
MRISHIPQEAKLDLERKRNLNNNTIITQTKIHIINSCDFG